MIFRLLVVVMLFVLAGCGSDTPSDVVDIPHGNSANDSQQETESNAVAPLVQDSARGAVRLQRVDDSRLVVSLADHAGDVSHFFILDAEDQLPPFESYTIEAASIKFASGTLAVYGGVDQHPRSVLLTVRDPGEVFRAIRQEGESSLEVTERLQLLHFRHQEPEIVLTGQSLVQRALGDDEAFTIEQASENTNYWLQEDAGEGVRPSHEPRSPGLLTSHIEPPACDDCTAGGGGAISCSYDSSSMSCSVACSSGTYACCGVPGCSCCPG